MVNGIWRCSYEGWLLWMHHGLLQKLRVLRTLGVQYTTHRSTENKGRFLFEYILSCGRKQSLVVVDVAALVIFLKHIFQTRRRRGLCQSLLLVLYPKRKHTNRRRGRGFKAPFAPCSPWYPSPLPPKARGPNNLITPLKMPTLNLDRYCIAASSSRQHTTHSRPVPSLR